MKKFPFTMIAKDYDYLVPIQLGDVAVEGVDLTLDTKTGIMSSTDDPAVLGGETSFSKHLIRLASGDRSFVGIPFFCYRGFRHRCFYVKNGSQLRSFPQLEGKRVGINAWPDTGNTWSRAALREQGVRIDKINWFIGPPEDLSYNAHMSGLEPANVQMAPAGKTLCELLLAGELDALMIPFVPKAVYSRTPTIIRLLPDYEKEERAYYKRTGIYPGHHIFVFQRAFFEKEPWVALSIYKALEESKKKWYQRRLYLGESTPWILPHLEEISTMMDGDWQPNGVEINKDMMQCLIDEQVAQGLTTRRISWQNVFTEFEEYVKSLSRPK